MTGLTAPSRRASKEEAEKPFWISFSDLMTALMVLFLVVMAAALLSVTEGVRHIEAQERHRTVSIASCMEQVREFTGTIPGVQVREHSVDFGTLARFQNNSSELNRDQQQFLQRFVPRVLGIAREPVCEEFLKQIVVEGFASQSGTYLHNLDLSAQRSERVLCTLMAPAGDFHLSAADRALIQNLFFAGGYSFNSTKKTDDDSRRIELRLDFYALREKQETPQQAKRIPALAEDNDTSCPIDAR
jgi:flagellar motor protein MotB